MPRYGTGAGDDYNDAIRRAQQFAQASDELKRKEAERTAAEERTAGAETTSAKVRGDVAGATRELTTALSANLSRITEETAAITINTEAWRRNAIARGEAAGRAVSGGTRATASPAAAAAVAHDPGAGVRYESAIAAQAAAEARAKAATSAYAGALRPTSGVPPGEQASLLAQQEEAKRGAQAARAETAAAQKNVQAQEQLAQQRQEAVAEQARINAALGAELAAQQRAVAQRVEQSARAVSGVAPLQLGAGAIPPQRLQLGEGGLFNLGSGEYGAARQAARQQAERVGAASRAVSGVAPLQLGAGPTAEATSAVAAHEERLGRLAAQQRLVNSEFQHSVAAYAGSSQALSRHGALTTEFIQAFARGQVTLKEFEGQMLSTIGKFSGWAIAAGLVYGAFNALKDLGQGASQTQAGVQQLGRFIPGLGGPAGGGRSQIPAAESTLRDISTQFNVPIKEVVDSMQIMARVFHNVSDAGDATRAVLAAVKLDQIPQAQATQYLTGISQSLNITSGKGVEGVVSSLNALQNTLGARVSQTLPAVARAAPAAQAGGLDTPSLLALAAIGVRAGITGPQVGTAILRSVGTFAFRPQAEATFQQYGITAQQGQYGRLLGDVTKLIDTREKSGRPLTGTDLRNLAQALGGPLLGTRTLLPILEQEQLHPGAIAGARATAAAPPSFQKDLDAVLGTLSERFRSLGVALQNLGSFLASSGILSPLVAAFDVFTGVLHAFEALVSPLVSILGVFNQLPGVVKDAVGAFIGFKAVSALYNSTFGSSAQGFLGRLPGLGSLDSEPRQAIRGTLGRLETFAEPQARADADSANRAVLRARGDQLAAIRKATEYENLPANIAASQQPPGTALRDKFDADTADNKAAIKNADRKAVQAAERAYGAGDRLASVTADIAILRDRQYSTAQKTTYLEERGLTIEEEIVNLQEQRLAQMRDQIRTGSTATFGRRSEEGRTAVSGAGAGAASQTEAAAAAIAGSAAIATAAAKAAAEPARRGTTYLSAAEAAAAARAAPPPRQFIAGPGGVEQVGGLYPPVQGSGAPIQGVLPPAAAEEEAGRLARSRAAVTEALKSAFTSGAAPFAGLIGSQLVGSTIGGGAGNYISGVGGTAATGAIIAQMLGRGTGGVLAGAALGTVAGSFQQNATSGIASLVGGGIGGALGLLGGPFAGLSVPAGAAIGSVAGSVVGNLFGGGAKTPADQQKVAEDAAAQERELSKRAQDQVIQNQLNAAVHARATGNQGGFQQHLDTANKLIAAQGQGTAGDITSFGTQFADDLATAFTATGDAATKAQQKIQQQVTDLTAQLKAFGGQSKTGQRAAQELDAAAAAAIGDVNVSPDKAGQIIDTAFQARQADIESRFKYTASTVAGGAGAAAAAAAAERASASADVYGSAVANAQADVDNAQGILQQAMSKGNSASIATAAKLLSGYQQKLQQAQDQGSQAAKATTVANQADYAAAYAQQQSIVAANAATAQAGAGGNKTQSLRAQIAQQAQLAQLASSSPIDPTQAALDQQNAAAKITDLHNQIAQQGLTELKARQSVTSAAVPTTDPAAVARQNLSNVEGQYKYILAHKSAFDPADINTALAAVIAAKQGVSQAAKDTEAQLNDIRGQIAQALAAGDSVLQAQIGIRTAATDLVLAGNDPKKIAAAQLAGVNAQNALHQATQQRIQAQGSLDKSADPNDAVGNALRDIATAQRVLANAHGIDEQTAAQQQLNVATNAYQQAVQSRTTAQGALDASKVTDPLRKLQALISAAAKNLAHAQGPDQITADQTTLNNLIEQRRAALITRSTARTGLRLAGADGDAVRQAQINVDHARDVLNAARGTEQIWNAEQALLTAETQLRHARLSRSNTLAQLHETQATGDTVRQAQIALAAARRQAAVAHGPDERIAAQQAEAAAQVQLHQATQQRIQAYGGLAVAQAQGDSVTIAQIQLQVAAQMLAGARGIDEQIAAETQLASAQYQYHQALQAQIVALGALAASTTREPLQQLSYEIHAAEQVLANAVGTQEKISAQTQLNSLRNQYQAAVISQTEGTINFQLQMKEITTQQAIAQLRSLEQTQNLTLQERQQLELQIRQLQLGSASGSFNLAPGHIKLPTIYDVRRALAGQTPVSPTGMITISNAPQINVYVGSAGDVPAVADAIDRATGSRLQAQLRAAGVS